MKRLNRGMAITSMLMVTSMLLAACGADSTATPVAAPTATKAAAAAPNCNHCGQCPYGHYCRCRPNGHHGCCEADNSPDHPRGSVLRRYHQDRG